MNLASRAEIFAGAASRVLAWIALALIALAFAAGTGRAQEPDPALRIPIAVPTGKPASDPWLRAGQWALGIATVADVTTTLARPRSSREANPLVPGNRALGAVVSGGLGALGIWGSGKLAAHGHRRLARGIAWGSAALRGYAAVRQPR